MITAIQHIRFKSKQRVNLQRIFRFINKVALSIECELFQDCMNRLEIDGGIHKKKRGVKILYFLLISFSRSATKMINRIAWRVHKSPESPKIIEKLESFADHDLGNIKNVTQSMHLINTTLLYLKDNSGGHSSNVCTNDRKSSFKESAG